MVDRGHTPASRSGARAGDAHSAARWRGALVSRVGALSMRRLTLLLSVAAAASVAALTWFGGRAILEWRHSAALLASRRAESAADLLVTSLTRDMRAVQTSILAAPHSADAAEIYDLIGVAFARYPYPEAFFTADGVSPDAMRFYGRSDRQLAWFPDTAVSSRFPVVVN